MYRIQLGGKQRYPQRDHNAGWSADDRPLKQGAALRLVEGMGRKLKQEHLYIESLSLPQSMHWKCLRGTHSDVITPSRSSPLQPRDTSSP